VQRSNNDFALRATAEQVVSSIGVVGCVHRRLRELSHTVYFLSFAESTICMRVRKMLAKSLGSEPVSSCKEKVGQDYKSLPNFILYQPSLLTSAAARK